MITYKHAIAQQCILLSFLLNYELISINNTIDNGIENPSQCWIVLRIKKNIALLNLPQFVGWYRFCGQFLVFASNRPVGWNTVGMDGWFVQQRDRYRYKTNAMHTLTKTKTIFEPLM